MVNSYIEYTTIVKDFITSTPKFQEVFKQMDIKGVDKLGLEYKKILNDKTFLYSFSIYDNSILLGCCFIRYTTTDRNTLDILCLFTDKAGKVEKYGMFNKCRVRDIIKIIKKFYLYTHFVFTEIIPAKVHPNISDMNINYIQEKLLKMYLITMPIQFKLTKDRNQLRLYNSDSEITVIYDWFYERLISSRKFELVENVNLVLNSKYNTKKILSIDEFDNIVSLLIMDKYAF